MRAIVPIAAPIIACDSDTTTKTFNDNPTIAIMSHADGFEALEGEAHFLPGLRSVTPTTTLRICRWPGIRGRSWFATGRYPLKRATATATSPLARVMPGIIAEVQDPAGAAGRSGDRAAGDQRSADRADSQPRGHRSFLQRSADFFPRLCWRSRGQSRGPVAAMGELGGR